MATTAKPKDYLGQAAALYGDIVRRWRYIRDPWGKELITFSPRQLYSMVLGADGVGLGRGRGGGDCDCVASLSGALLRSIGFPVRLATTAPTGFPPGNHYTHVFVQTQIPGFGWVTFDPVVYPQHGLGYTTPHSRIAFFDLAGRQIGGRGNNQRTDRRR